MTSLTSLLAKAQADMAPPKMDKKNPHFGNKYASLAAMRESVVPALAKHGLALTQTTDFHDGAFILRTTLRGPDGEIIESTYPLPVAKPQEMGSAITYARRYTMAALVGIAAEEDDDGNAGQKADKPAAPKAAPPKAAPPAPAEGEPHEIPLGDLVPVVWGGQFIATIKASENSAALNGWVAENAKTIAGIMKTAPKAHASIIAAIEKVRADLTRIEGAASESTMNAG
jgi:hypothetical protein